jgi:hypothetical protein
MDQRSKSTEKEINRNLKAVFEAPAKSPCPEAKNGAPIWSAAL